jgi:hypothetical protein
MTKKAKQTEDSKFDRENKVLSYVKKLNLIDCNKISTKTSIENDLGLTGDDAIEFIENFAEKFMIDIELFQYEKYFKPETGGFFHFSVKRAEKELKLEDLIYALKVGILE